MDDLRRRPAHRLSTSLFLSAVALLGAACSSGTATSPSSSGGSAADAAGQSDPAGSAGSVSDAQAICTAYLTCISEIAPESGGALVALYGASSPCWKGGSQEAALCGKDCGAKLTADRRCRSSVPPGVAAECPPSEACTLALKKTCARGASGCAANDVCKERAKKIVRCDCNDASCITDTASTAGLTQQERVLHPINVCGLDPATGRDIPLPEGCDPYVISAYVLSL